MVRTSHLPFEISQVEILKENNFKEMYRIIDELSAQGLGPRKISNALKDLNYDFKYYQVAYYLNKK